MQLSKKNTRFQYKIIKTGARAAEYSSISGAINAAAPLLQYMAPGLSSAFSKSPVMPSKHSNG